MTRPQSSASSPLEISRIVCSSGETEREGRAQFFQTGLFFSPSGGEFCIKENLEREENCNTAQSNRQFNIRVGFHTRALLLVFILPVVQFAQDTCLLNITTVQNTDFGTWSCHGNDFDTWVGGKVKGLTVW